MSGDKLKICDFACALKFDEDEEVPNYESELIYKAPEIIMKSEYVSNRQDIFQAGLVFAEMYKFRPLINGKSP
jgi:serine/threonine protein kinase